MKKRKMSKKEVMVLAIVNSLLAVFWIYEAISYTNVYFEIRELVGGMPSPGLKVAAAVVWSVSAIVWIIRYFRYDELSKNTDA